MNLTGSVPLDSNSSSQPSNLQGGRNIALWGAVLMAVCPLLISQRMSEEPWIVPRIFMISLATLWIWLMGKKTHKPLLTIPIMIFVGIVSLTMTTSIDPLVSFFGQFYGQFHGLLQVGLCVLVYFAFATTDIPREKFGSAILYTSIAIGVWAVAQKLKHMGLQDGRAASGFGSPVYLGNYVALVIPLAWIWLRSNKRWLGSSALIMGVISAIAARSRGGAAAGVFGILVYEYLQGNKKQVFWAVIAGVMLALISHPFHHDSDLGRVAMWKIAFQGWLEHPWVGNGPDTYGLIFRKYDTQTLVKYLGDYKLISLSAHNDIMQVLSTMGVIGLTAYIFLIASVIELLYKRKEYEITAILAAVWCQAQVNPVHIVILSYAAAFLGTIRNMEPFKWRWSYAAGFASIVICLFSLEECRAITYESDAMRMGYQSKYVEATKLFHQAAVIAPWDLHFQQRELNALWTITRILDKNQIDNFVGLSMMTAMNAAILHPNDPTAHDMLAHALKTIDMFKGVNTLKQSKEQMAIANHLAPTYADYAADLKFIEAQGG